MDNFSKELIHYLDNSDKPMNRKINMNIDDLTEIIHIEAKEKGWWEAQDLNNSNCVAAKLALIHSEVSEALEALRKGELDLTYIGNHETNTPKPEGLLVELADTVVRICDLAEALYRQGQVKHFLSEAIRAKMKYNRTRPHRLGGKAL